MTMTFEGLLLCVLEEWGKALNVSCKLIDTTDSTIALLYQLHKAIG
jgi:hypothetical protein